MIFYIFAIFCFVCFIECKQSPIKHVVAVMYENRAFDHMLGHLKSKNHKINGLTGKETNPIDPRNPSAGHVRVSFDAVDSIPMNPGHSVESTEFEIWGSEKRVSHPPMNGFVGDMLAHGEPLEIAKKVMQCYNESTLSTLSFLAKEYALFDSWFSSIPGPTFPNRLMAWAATSNGWASNSINADFAGFPQRSIFADFRESDFGQDFNYKVYFSDFPTPAVLDDVRAHPLHIRPLEELALDAALGELPPFSWIGPRFFSIGDFIESDEHPHTTTHFTGDSIKAGDDLLKWIYDTLRTSPAWNDTALLIYYDEHGGLYDHVAPPQTGVPAPDHHVSKNPPFDFTRLGVRVPAVLVSPRVQRGSLVRPPSGKHFDHTSFLATLRQIFPQLPQRPLSKREAWVADFADVLNHPPRAHTPPAPGGKVNANAVHHDDGTLQALYDAEARDTAQAAVHRATPLSDLQHDLVTLAAGMAGDHPDSDVLATARSNIAEGALYIRKTMQKLMSNNKK